MTSNKEKVLFLKPPPIGERNDGATHKIKDFVCPSCLGRGALVYGTGYHGSEKGEEIRSTCNRCAGTGKLMADVVVRWSPQKQLDDE